MLKNIIKTEWNNIEETLFFKYWIPLIKRCEEKSLFKDSKYLFDESNTIHKSVFYELCDLYKQPHRKYHNLNHIISLFELHDKIQQLYNFNDKESLEFAIFFHDSIYNTNRKEHKYNEIKSAKFARKKLYEMNFNFNFIERVALYINSTNYNIYKNSLINNDVKYLHDLDFSYFILDYLDFLKIDEQIKYEFSWFIRKFIYPKKRKEFLNNLYSKQKYGDNYIFRTKLFIDHYEDKAIENIFKYLNEK